MSDFIFDHPELLDEEIIKLKKAPREFRTKCSRSTLERWIREGVRGAILETVKIGRTRYTSKEAIRRFLVGQQRTEPEKAPSKKTMTEKEIKEKSKRFNLPEPEEKKKPKPR